MEGATSVCKEKEKKGKGLGHVPQPLPPVALIQFGFWPKKLFKRKEQPSITLKERKTWLLHRRKTNSGRYLLLICSPQGDLLLFNQKSVLPLRDAESA